MSPDPEPRVADAPKGEPNDASGKVSIEAPNATDEAISLADDNDLDLSEIEGSGAEGKVTVGDVRKAIKAVEDAEKEEGEPEPGRYTYQQVIDGGHGLTGYSRVILSGALHGRKEEDFSVEEVKAAAEKFLGRKVEVKKVADA